MKSKSKSVRRGGDEVVVENKINANEPTEKKVFGLSGELALAAAQGKRAQQKIKKEMKKKQEEEDEQRAMI